MKTQFSDVGAKSFQESLRPSIEFSADIIFHSKIKEYWIIELVAFVENKGQVQHRMYEFGFNLKGIKRDTNLRISQIAQDRRQVEFPVVLIENGKGTFLPVGAKYFFVEPGVKGKYSFLSRVHESLAVLSFHTWFDYPYTKESHIAEATKAVPDK